MKRRFQLAEIDPFDARRGYRRWCRRGIDVILGDFPKAGADLWEDREGRLVTRFESLGYTLHFEIRPVRGHRITHEDADEIEDFLDQKLQQWIIEGVDD